MGRGRAKTDSEAHALEDKHAVPLQPHVYVNTEAAQFPMEARTPVAPEHWPEH